MRCHMSVKFEQYIFNIYLNQIFSPQGGCNFIGHRDGTGVESIKPITFLNIK